MPRTLCILHANCQGDALRPLLENTPAFARHFYIRQYLNYTSQQIADADLGRCTLLLHQYLAPRWGGLSTEQMLPRLPAGCRHLEIPNLFFKGYWPFWTSSGQGIDFTDSLLERLIGQGLAPIDVLRLYLRGDTALLGDVAAVAEASLAQEEAKEAGKPVGCAHILRERWREEQLFITVNHPSKELVCHVADTLLRLLELGPLPDSVRNAWVHPHEDFWLPVHPALGKILGLPFASAERRYRIFDCRLTHREYTTCYLACRQHGVTDLLTLLRNLPANRGLLQL
ncbi:MAG: WcbI family polysaccharide biosynthesis putative acetyltransferase [Desulfovibrionaceae bacterium]|nr:WcbI family polysaccharide biosynthesis putative acetyltransferase [Desulfovibrionaceae bacterium]